MIRFNSTVLAAAAVLLSGCAADGAQQAGDKYLDASYTPTGTLIPRKAPSRTDNVMVADKQALENDRTNMNGTNNWAAPKN
jgi:type IV pilus biogenesis protein CpaD/CtpE